MKIAFIVPYKRVAPHFETELELAQRHLDAGDQVEFVSCVGHLSNCDFNNQKQQSACEECVGRQLAGLSSLEGTIKVRQLKPPKKQTNAHLPDVHSISDLIKLKIDNFDIGYSCLSSLVSSVRDPEPNITANKEVLNKFYQSALATFISTKTYLETSKPGRVYVFNGRFSSMRAVLRACQFQGVECAIHERGFDKDHFQLYIDHLPHDIQYIQNRINEQWSRAGRDPKRNQVASHWFEGRRTRIETNWKSFVKDQIIGQLPQGFDKNKRNIAVFVSSEDEFVAIGDQWKHPIYNNQADGIHQLINSFEKDERFHFYLRIHPNLKGLNNTQTKALETIKSHRLTKIAADSTVDTYQLITACEKTVSFGSSVGIEATYWNRPSILLGTCLYRGLGSTYEPADHDTAIKLIEEELDPMPKEGALRYGYWFQSHGMPFEYFVANDLFTGTFKGKEIYPKQKHSIPRKIELSFRQLLKRLKIKRAS